MGVVQLSNKDIWLYQRTGSMTMVTMFATDKTTSVVSGGQMGGQRETY